MHTLRLLHLEGLVNVVAILVVSTLVLACTTMSTEVLTTIIVKPLHVLWSMCKGFCILTKANSR